MKYGWQVREKKTTHYNAFEWGEKKSKRIVLALDKREEKPPAMSSSTTHLIRKFKGKSRNIAKFKLLPTTKNDNFILEYFQCITF